MRRAGQRQLSQIANGGTDPKQPFSLSRCGRSDNQAMGRPEWVER